VTTQRECTIEEYFDLFCRIWRCSEESLRAYLNDLKSDAAFLGAINQAISNVPEFRGKQFADATEMRVYRVMLYMLIRATRPEVFIETGVHNGMSSAFILLAMQHNGHGKLVSIDLPPVDQRILDQGTNALPAQKAPGWLIPDYLRARHELRLGRAEFELPRALENLGEIGGFLHDSDHCYSHIAFELGVAYAFTAPGGWLAVDNIEQNAAFDDFARGVESEPVVVSTFDGPDRIWRHGLFQKGG
jgi:hypothetical protein